MDTFTVITNALRESEADAVRTADAVGYQNHDTGRIMAAVQTVVDTLTPPDGGRYIVGFANVATAGTSLSERRITVSSKPLRDPRLSLIEKAVVIATFAAHEIGHTYITAGKRAALVKSHAEACRFPGSGYHALANLADDIVLEPFMVERFPILRDAFAFTGAWVLRSTQPTLPITRRIEHGQKTSDRFNVALSATRYGDIPEIIWDGERAVEERDWYRAWADRLIALPVTNLDGYIALLDEAWHRMRQPEPEPETQPQPPITDGPVGPSNDEPQPPDEGGSDEPTDGGDEPEGPTGEDEGPTGESDEPEGDEPEGEGGSEGEDEDEDGDETEPTDEGGEGGDDESDDEPEGGDGDDEGGDKGGEGPPPTFGDEDEDEDGEDGEPNGDGDDESHDGDGERHGDESEPNGGQSDGGGDPENDGSDFDKDDVDESTHDQSEADPRETWEQQRADEAIRAYNGTDRLAFGQHGSFTVHWD